MPGGGVARAFNYDAAALAAYQLQQQAAAKAAADKAAADAAAQAEQQRIVAAAVDAAQQQAAQQAATLAAQQAAQAAADKASNPPLQIKGGGAPQTYTTSGGESYISNTGIPLSHEQILAREAAAAENPSTGFVGVKPVEGGSGASVVSTPGTFNSPEIKAAQDKINQQKGITYRGERGAGVNYSVNLFENLGFAVGLGLSSGEKFGEPTPAPKPVGKNYSVNLRENLGVGETLSGTKSSIKAAENTSFVLTDQRFGTPEARQNSKDFESFIKKYSREGATIELLSGGKIVGTVSGRTALRNVIILERTYPELQARPQLGTTKEGVDFVTNEIQKAKGAGAKTIDVFEITKIVAAGVIVEKSHPLESIPIEKAGKELPLLLTKYSDNPKIQYGFTPIAYQSNAPIGTGLEFEVLTPLEKIMVDTVNTLTGKTSTKEQIESYPSKYLSAAVENVKPTELHLPFGITVKATGSLPSEVVTGLVGTGINIIGSTIGLGVDIGKKPLILNPSLYFANELVKNPNASNLDIIKSYIKDVSFPPEAQRAVGKYMPESVSGDIISGKLPQSSSGYLIGEAAGEVGFVLSSLNPTSFIKSFLKSPLKGSPEDFINTINKNIETIPTQDKYTTTFVRQYPTYRATNMMREQLPKDIFSQDTAETEPGSQGILIPTKPTSIKKLSTIQNKLLEPSTTETGSIVQEDIFYNPPKTSIKLSTGEVNVSETGSPLKSISTNVEPTRANTSSLNTFDNLIKQNGSESVNSRLINKPQQDTSVISGSSSNSPTGILESSTQTNETQRLSQEYIAGNVGITSGLNNAEKFFEENLSKNGRPPLLSFVKGGGKNITTVQEDPFFRNAVPMKSLGATKPTSKNVARVDVESVLGAGEVNISETGSPLKIESPLEFNPSRAEKVSRESKLFETKESTPFDVLESKPVQEDPFFRNAVPMKSLGATKPTSKNVARVDVESVLGGGERPTGEPITGDSDFTSTNIDLGKAFGRLIPGKIINGKFIPDEGIAGISTKSNKPSPPSEPSKKKSNEILSQTGLVQVMKEPEINTIEHAFTTESIDLGKGELQQIEKSKPKKGTTQILIPQQQKKKKNVTTETDYMFEIFGFTPESKSITKEKSKSSLKDISDYKFNTSLDDLLGSATNQVTRQTERIKEQTKPQYKQQSKQEEMFKQETVQVFEQTFKQTPAQTTSTPSILLPKQPQTPAQTPTPKEKPKTILIPTEEPPKLPLAFIFPKPDNKADKTTSKPKKPFDFLGNSSEFSILGIYNRKETTYGRKTIKSFLKKDINLHSEDPFKRSSTKKVYSEKSKDNLSGLFSNKSRKIRF